MNKQIPSGLHKKRLLTGVDWREEAFWNEWRGEHKTPGVDNRDLLLNLFEVPCADDDPEKAGGYKCFSGSYKRPLGFPTERDRIVASTVIQWLGTNCGIDFVNLALRRAGGSINWPKMPKHVEKKAYGFVRGEPINMIPGLEDGRHKRGYS